MKILILEDDLVEYAKHLVAARLASGFVNIEELQTVHTFHAALMKAADVDFSKLGNVDLQGLKPGENGGITLGLGVSEPQSPRC